jgi:hypothetical protein
LKKAANGEQPAKGNGWYVRSVESNFQRDIDNEGGY